MRRGVYKTDCMEDALPTMRDTTGRRERRELQLNLDSSERERDPIGGLDCVMKRLRGPVRRAGCTDEVSQAG